ncbi:MAG TPA: type II toxin-antitoxin system YafQ family toxin [Candidatus Cloacimonas acidaminovorans]|nr:type II toxin-antitoxin system YafQ family toxin [Candidatus Cloacimonas acidaminovorans]HRS61170.1 type II toxin-antitoxin system YafQ family toxin [Candidatus Cloacimonas sp.]HOE54996.1 type II toxin-antitoxin system YafQ family toxin [Candidatus Cloacimonas acidaminovorans]HOM79063.1 type II toxin-antitoxin system YafQ family toxin [Candidatus Cloacimonas acidaminovorans]HOS06919.1 type II toxin-antitoxin system YafQ family toxin [Candidatus Cloacimonas acidaminovorans]
MLKLSYTSQFKKDYKRYEHNKTVIDALQEALNKLITEIPLPAKYKDHQLKGNLNNCRECHLTPDVLLLYRIQDEVLILVRIGTHSNLFN